MNIPDYPMRPKWFPWIIYPASHKSGQRCDSSRGLFALKACATYTVSSLPWKTIPKPGLWFQHSVSPWTPETFSVYLSQGSRIINCKVSSSNNEQAYLCPIWQYLANAQQVLFLLQENFEQSQCGEGQSASSHKSQATGASSWKLWCHWQQGGKAQNEADSPLMWEQEKRKEVSRQRWWLNQHDQGTELSFSPLWEPLTHRGRNQLNKK